MSTFRDSNDKTWPVTITVATIKRVRDLIDIDLLAVAEGKLIDELVLDPVLLCNVLYAVCKQTADEANISDEQFGELMAGDTIDLAVSALLEALVDFFPSRRRTILAKMTAKIRDLEATALAMAETKLDSPEMDRAIADALGA